MVTFLELNSETLYPISNRNESSTSSIHVFRKTVTLSRKLLSGRAVEVKEMQQKAKHHARAELSCS